MDYKGYQIVESTPMGGKVKKLIAEYRSKVTDCDATISRLQVKIAKERLNNTMSKLEYDNLLTDRRYEYDRRHIYVQYVKALEELL